MADQALSTSRRAVLTGICTMFPLAIALAAPPQTEVEMAWQALQFARRTPLSPGDTLYREDLIFMQTLPVTLTDVKLKAIYARAQVQQKGDYWPALRLLSEIEGVA